MTNYKYEEKLEKPQWTLEKDTKEIIDHKCQKATAHFKGRTWTAWYTPEIPVQEGPWKLNGLPGLILEAQDSDNLYHFSAIGLKEITSRAISLPTRKYLDCTRKEYIQQKIECYKDPIEYMKIRSITFSSMTNNGKPVKISQKKYIDIEIDEK
jgi:GLPGLI family protein